MVCRQFVFIPAVEVSGSIWGTSQRCAAIDHDGMARYRANGERVFGAPCILRSVRLYESTSSKVPVPLSSLQ